MILPVIQNCAIERPRISNRLAYYCAGRMPVNLENVPGITSVDSLVVLDGRKKGTSEIKPCVLIYIAETIPHCSVFPFVSLFEISQSRLQKIRNNHHGHTRWKARQAQYWHSRRRSWRNDGSDSHR